MVTDDWQRRMISHVAYLYYIKKDKQKKIAEQIGVDRTTISRMLKRAQKQGIVTFSINGFDTSLFELEQRLKEKYHLKTVLLADDEANESERDKERSISHLVLHYLKQILNVGDIVGLSWGRALAMMADGVSNIGDLDATFVPLAGGPSKKKSQYHVNGIVYDLARKFKSRSKFINATALQSNSFRANQVRQKPACQELQKYWHEMKIAVVGVGGPLAKNSSWRDLLTQKDLARLNKENIVGDCCCHFFNDQGQLTDHDIEERLIACPLQLLKKVPYRIGLVQSVDKAKAIQVLMKTSLINVLITDRETALALL